MAEEVAAAKLARERAAREARMEEAITRARMRLEHEESASWSRRLEQAALAVRLPCSCGPQGLVLCNSFIHYTLSNPQIRCVAANSLWQPSSLPCLGIFSTM